MDADSAGAAAGAGHAVRAGETGVGSEWGAQPQDECSSVPV